MFVLRCAVVIVLVIVAAVDVVRCRIMAITRRGRRGYERWIGARQIRWKWDTCETMNPTLGSFLEQETPFPFDLNVSTYVLKNTESLYFTIAGRNGQRFQSFMLQARDRFYLAVGTYRATPGSKITLIDCTKGRNNCALHGDNSLKESQTIQWIPDEEFSGKIAFWITVAEKQLKFWLRRQTDPVTVTW